MHSHVIICRLFWAGAWQKRVLEASAGIVTLACVVDLQAERTEDVTFIVACQCTVDGRVV